MSQYFRSADEGVLESLQNYNTAIADAQASANEFRLKVTTADTPMYGGTQHGEFLIVGLEFKTPPAKWKKARQGYVPFKNNPLSAEFEALSVRLPKILGLPMAVFQLPYLLTPAMFIRGGCMYANYGQPLLEDADGRPNDLWEPIKASQWHLALEQSKEQA